MRKVSGKIGRHADHVPRSTVGLFGASPKADLCVVLAHDVMLRTTSVRRTPLTVRTGRGLSVIARAESIVFKRLIIYTKPGCELCIGLKVGLHPIRLGFDLRPRGPSRGPLLTVLRCTHLPAWRFIRAS